MAFRYSLLSILRLRQALERQEEQKLLALAARVARLRLAIGAMDAEQVQTQRDLLDHLNQGGVAAELQFAGICTTAYQRVRKQLLEQMNECEAERLEQMKAYRHARQKREILEGLREHQEAAYVLESLRREQQNADEAFLLRQYREGRDQILPS
jgi:flagellar export protein FliJ